MQMSRKPVKKKDGQGKGRRAERETARPGGESPGRPVPDLHAVASATECTGMKPALPPDELAEQ